MKALGTIRWAAQTEASAAVLKDYLILLELMEEIHCATLDEYRLKAHWIFAALEKFYTFFGFCLGHLLFVLLRHFLRVYRLKITHYKKAGQQLLFVKLFMIDKERRNHSIACIIKWLNKLVKI